MKKLLTTFCLSIIFILLSSGCAVGPHSHDPLESVNRKVDAFNTAVDSAVIKPIAKGYRSYVPSFVRTGVRNFFRNLGVLNTAVNDTLQLKYKRAPVDLARFVTNVVLGIGGVFDPATELGIPYYQEDFGQTLGYWGVPSGPYLVLPFFGPSTIRDGLSKPVDFSTDPIYFVNEDDVRWKLIGLQAVDTRSNLFETEQVVNDAAIDKYSFIRDTWLQRREFQIHDGNLPRDGNSNSGVKSLRELELEDFPE